ncbi:Spy/CpxP family protein refolding chaperone [Xanthobacter sp. DSM 24535]|uniref:Spy/CpxP family protein refolding chaperone n=1 Tax=Roseixanthobacter psychrophilus TaxID=3119917 RepID=UPI00372A0A60
MKSLLSAVVVAAAIGTSSLAFAQQAAEPVSVYSAADARAVLNARLAALKTVIELTPEQEKLWPPLETAIRNISKNAAQRRQDHEKVAPKDFLDILDVVAADDEARAKDLKQFLAAARPLVASLTPEQRLRIPAFLGLREGPRPQPSSEMWIFEEEE